MITCPSNLSRVPYSDIVVPHLTPAWMVDAVASWELSPEMATRMAEVLDLHAFHVRGGGWVACTLSGREVLALTHQMSGQMHGFLLPAKGDDEF